MLDGLPILTNVGAGTVVVIIVFMILTGRLVPRRTLDDALADRDAWRSVATLATEQGKELLVLARAADRVLSALPLAGERSKRGPT